jgi:hypothetical protein
MAMTTKLSPEQFKFVYVLDTEFVAQPGERQRPVCLVAQGFHQGRDIEVFFDAPSHNPFLDLSRTLFIGYNLSAEFQTMLALGWDLPQYCIDLHFEFLNMVNGVWYGSQSLMKLGTGLQDAVTHFGGSPLEFWKSDKDAERQYVIENGTIPPVGTSVESHRRRILAYCHEDVSATVWLGQRMLCDLDLEQALWRGCYAKANAWFQHNGLPVDLHRFHAIEQEADKLKLKIVEEIEAAHSYGVYQIEKGQNGTLQPVFKMSNFKLLLASMGIQVGCREGSWRATPGGMPVLDDDYLSAMCKGYPQLEPLRQCRKTLRSLSQFGSLIGSDGFNRTNLWAFGTLTSRNNPKSSSFLLGRPHWVRNLLTPRGGMALVSCDVTGAEDWLAAGFSGDPELMRIYSSGNDSYMEFAAVTGAVPAGTPRNRANGALELIRSAHKTAKMSIQYGVGGTTLGQYLGVAGWKAGWVINSHKRAYSVYWQWGEDQAELAEELEYVATDFGWRQSTQHMSERSLLNFPQQAGCAELLRCACNLLVDVGWGYALAAPHHDALYLHCESDRAEECKKAVEEAFIQAGQIVMGLPEFPLRVHSEITYYPDHYRDEDGREIWDIVCQYFGWIRRQNGEVDPSPLPL